MISNATLYSEESNLHNTMHNEVTVINNSKVNVFNTDGHMRTITILTNDISKSNHIIGTKIIRNDKGDKRKGFGRILNHLFKVIAFFTHSLYLAPLSRS